MKKTIASIALLVSATSAHALMPPSKEEIKTQCLSISSVSRLDGSMIVSTCDESRNNETLKKKLKKNGCAVNQVAVKSYGEVVGLCMPAGAVQL